MPGDASSYALVRNGVLRPLQADYPTLLGRKPQVKQHHISA